MPVATLYTDRFVLWGWVKTSSVHAYPVEQFRGTARACEERREQANFPQGLSIRHENDPPRAY